MVTKQRFFAVSAKTQIDAKTQLQWISFAIGQKKLTPSGYEGEAKLFSWQQLHTLINKLNTTKGFAGHYDWRIPSAAELQTLLDADQAGELIGLEDTLEFWSSTPAEEGKALVVSRQKSEPYAKLITSAAAVRLVRDATSDSLPTTRSTTQNKQPRTTRELADLAMRQSRATVEQWKDQSLNKLKEAGIEERAAEAREHISLFKLFGTRVLKSDFFLVRARPDESSILAKAEQPVTSPIAQDYASWRRSLLMISLAGLCLGLFFQLIDTLLLFHAGAITWVMHFQGVALFTVQVTTTFLCWMAARSWSNLARSRSLARLAWLAQFVLPLLIFMLPFSLLIQDQSILAQIGLAALLALAPKVFGLFPGLIRCSLTMKTLLPESSAPGWLGLLIAPFYSLLLFIVAIVALQIAEIFLALGLILLSMSMAVVILRSQHLLAPQQQDQASLTVRGIKKHQLIFQLIGITFVGLFVIKHAELQMNWFSSLFSFSLAYIANVTLLTVVMSDFLLAMINKARHQASAFTGTEMEQQLDLRLQDLSACGLTSLEAGEAELAASLRSRGEVWAHQAKTQRQGL